MGVIENMIKLKRLDASYPKLKLKEPAFVRNNNAIVQVNINGVIWRLAAQFDGYWETMDTGESYYGYISVPVTSIPEGTPMRFELVPIGSNTSNTSIYSNTFMKG